MAKLALLPGGVVKFQRGIIHASTGIYFHFRYRGKLILIDNSQFKLYCTILIYVQSIFNTIETVHPINRR